MDISVVFFFLMRVFGLGWGMASDGDRMKYCHALVALLWLTFLSFLLTVDFTLYLTFFRHRVQDMDFSALTIGIYRCYVVAEAMAMLAIAKIIGNQPVRLFNDIRRVCFLDTEELSSKDNNKRMRKVSILRKQRYTWQVSGILLLLWTGTAATLLGVLQSYFFTRFASGALKGDFSIPIQAGIMPLPVYGMAATFFLDGFTSVAFDMLLQMIGVWCSMAIGYGFRKCYKDLKVLSKAIDAKQFDTEGQIMERVEALSAQHLALSQLVNRTDEAFSLVNLLAYLRDFLGFVTGCAAILRADEDITGDALLDANAKAIAMGVDTLARTTCAAYLGVSMLNCVLRTTFFIRVTETGKSALRPLSMIFEQVETLDSKTSMILILNRIRGHSLTLTGGGLFSLDRSFVVTMFGTFFSFFILVYQMQDQKKDIYSVISQDDVGALASQVANITRQIMSDYARS